jgi:hypothetical protein
MKSERFAKLMYLATHRRVASPTVCLRRLVSRVGLSVALLSATLLPVPRSMPAQVTGLAAAYAFDEGTGSTTSDASGNGNTGQIHGATWSTLAKYGNALSFDGASSYVDLGAGPAFQNTGSMSWTAWVYATANPPDDGQIAALSTDNSGWQFKTTPDTGVRTFGIAVSPDGASFAQRYSQTVLALNTWYHVAGVYDAAAQTLDIYVNGVPDDGALTGTVPAAQVIPAGVNASIGQRAGGYFFNGVIDNLRIYNRALSATEVQSDMNTPVSAAVAGLVAAYSFNEGAGPTVSDFSGNNNTGTINGAVWTASGRYGAGLQFDGASALVTVNDSASLHLTNAMTLEAWVNPASGGGWQDVIYKGNDAYYLEGSSDSGPRPAGGGTFNSVDNVLYSSSNLPANTWTHLALTYDGATLLLYVNGLQVASSAVTGALAASTYPLQIGGDSIFGQYFSGVIDEVRIYNIALPPDRIQADMITPLGPLQPDTTPPSAPASLAATAVSPSQIDLSWTASADNVGVAGYRVYRDGIQVATTMQTGYADVALAAATAYTYTVEAFDAAQNASPPSAPATSTTLDSNSTSSGAPGIRTPFPIYPVKVGPTGRYLSDQSGVPFLIVGDSPQALIVNLSLAQANTYFADRKAAGFNTVWVNLLCNSYTGGRDDGSTYDGLVPFTIPGDLSTPNEAYFARADAMIQLAGQYGITVMLDPAETGGWLSVLNSNGVTAARNYGRYLGNRYKGFDNIIWLSGNDFQSWSNTADDAVVQAVAQGIKDNDTRHIHTLELNYYASESLDDASWAPIVSLNAAYTYYPTYAEVLKGYNNPNTMPVFMVEANYEFEHGYIGPSTLRRQEYWSMLSGATGQLYGNHYTWPFLNGWETNLDTTGSTQMGYVTALFGPRRWYDLVPDQNHTLVTAGYGAFSATGDVNSNNYVTAAATPDGALAIAYLPANTTITVQMSAFAGPVTAQWYDPTTGLYVPVSGSPLPNNGSMQFSPPGLNGGGDADWALVFEVSGGAATGRRPRGGSLALR